MDLKQTELDLMSISVKELINKISDDDNAECNYVRQKAFDHWSEKGELLQVQIMVVRNDNDFLDDFETEIMNTYKPKKP
jgi:molybdopterin converting factor small subunit